MNNPIPVRGGPPPVKAMPLQSVAPVAKAVVKFGKVGKDTSGDRIILYGTGGVGKTTLACSLPGPVAFFDLDKSLEKLGKQAGGEALLANVIPVEGITTWTGLRSALQSDGWNDVRSIVIDTATVAEQMAIDWMFANIREKGAPVSRMEDYGYKSGYRHLYDTFNLLFSDLDVHARAGRHVVLICHDCTVKVTNPEGTDWVRYEPRLAQDDKNCQLRYRAKEWADTVLACRFDISVSKEGKAQGSGTRTVYASELPLCMAKSRTTQGAFPVVEGQDFWSNIIY